MLRNNLSSRPFYNERSVTVVLGLVAVAVLGLTAFNVTRIVSLSRERGGLQAQINRDQEAAALVRTETAAIDRALGTSTLNGLLVSTREANSLIDRRTFSWTVFFDYIERTLPYDVRLVAVAPRTDKGAFLVQMIVVTRRPADLEAFFRALRETGAFSDVLATAGQSNEDGTLRQDVQANYHPPKLSPPETAASAPAAPAPPRGGRGAGSSAGGRP
jgi:hypothetical protein